MKTKDIERLAELAARYEIIHDSITPEGLELLEKYHRPHRPWWARLWAWVKRGSK